MLQQKVKMLSILGVLAGVPMVSLAQSNSPDLTWFETLVRDFGGIVNQLVYILIALAFVVFVWGLITFIFSSHDDTAKAEGRSRMIWGVLALFVITAIWGILALLRGITGTDTNQPQYPVWRTTP